MTEAGWPSPAARLTTLPAARRFSPRPSASRWRWINGLTSRTPPVASERSSSRSISTSKCPALAVKRSSGPGFVERQSRAGQLTALLQPPEPHEAGGRLLGPADQALEHRTTGGVSRHQQVSAVIDRDLRAAFQQSTDVRGIGLSILSMDRPYLDPVPGHERGGHVILNREWVC